MDKNLDLKRVCHVQPLGVTRNATFIIDVDDVLFSDIKADDLGTWSPNGTKSTHFFMTNGAIRIAGGKPTGSSYVLTRRYYTLGTYHLLKRILTDIRDNYNL